MPTGFEAVGLALAIFPVLVEGLKLYAEERGVIKSILRYQHVLKRMIRDLGREQTSFHNSCKLFLENVATQSGYSEGEILDMMQDPGMKWTKAQWSQDITNEDTVRRYLETVEDMNEELSKIQEWLGIRGDGSVSTVTPSINMQWDRCCTSRENKPDTMIPLLH